MMSIRRLSVLMLTLALPGCVSTVPSMETIIPQNLLVFDINKVPMSEGPALAPASLPKYVVGETFEFDDGRIDTVTAIDGERIVWTNMYGVDVLRYRNFIVPDLEWTSANRSSALDTDAMPKDLWPLSPGKVSKRFHALQQVAYLEGGRPPLSIDHDWQCRVVGMNSTQGFQTATFGQVEVHKHEIQIRIGFEQIDSLAAGTGLKQFDTIFHLLEHQNKSGTH